MTEKREPAAWLLEGTNTVEFDRQSYHAGPEWTALYELTPAEKAAPDLLEALEMAVRQNSHDMMMTGEELRKCEAAIARAKGEQE